MALCFLICTFAANLVSNNALNNYIMAKLKGAVIALANKVNLHGYPYVEAVNEEACVGCASCGIVCPDGCITVYRKKVEE